MPLRQAFRDRLPVIRMALELTKKPQRAGEEPCRSVLCECGEAGRSVDTTACINVSMEFTPAISMRFIMRHEYMFEYTKAQLIWFSIEKSS
jgi:hypothetical protein